MTRECCCGKNDDTETSIPPLRSAPLVLAATRPSRPLMARCGRWGTMTARGAGATVAPRWRRPGSWGGADQRRRRGPSSSRWVWGGATCWPSPVAAPTLPTILPPTQWSVFFTPQGQFVVQVSVGRYHTIAVTVDGSVYTWGLNDWGQLGRAAVGASSAEDPTECFSGGSCHDGAPKKVGQLEGEGVGEKLGEPWAQPGEHFALHSIASHA